MRTVPRHLWPALLVLATLLVPACRPPVPAPPPAPPKVSEAIPFPRDLVAFVPLAKNPVFQAAGPGHWDAQIRERGWILRENGTYKLYYTGYDDTADARRRLGLATSPDGVAWTRHPDNPLLPDLWVEDMMVVKEGDRYLMFAEGENDRAQFLTSSDGLHWQPHGRLDVRLANGQPIPDGPYGTPTALKHQGRWLLFYERDDKGIWLAASDDLKTWRNLQDDPVLLPGPDAYDRDQIALNQVVPYQGRFYAYYHGSATTGPNAHKWSTAVAASDDLLHWTKYPGNPLLPTADNKSSGILVDTGSGFRLYTMHPAVYLHVPEKTSDARTGGGP